MDIIRTFTTASGKIGSVTRSTKKLDHGAQELITYTVTVNGTPVYNESFDKIFDSYCLFSTIHKKREWYKNMKIRNTEKEAEVLRKIDASVKYRMRM
jgi:hypothetical protein